MRSQFGPVMVSGDMSEVSLYLPGPRLLSYGMEQLVWAGERHVKRFLYSRDGHQRVAAPGARHAPQH